MPRRNIVLANHEIYHVYNRSVGRETIFDSKIYLRKILESTNYYRLPQTLRLSQFQLLPNDRKASYLLSLREKKPLVEIYAFSFMPNHFHFVLKQLEENGIMLFLKKIQDSYAQYFNVKNNRHGSLFQNPFKAKRIETEEQLMHVIRYVHLNHVTAFLINFDDLADCPYTSYRFYCEEGKDSLINPGPILELFGSKDKIKEFTADQVDYQRQLALIKDLIIE